MNKETKKMIPQLRFPEFVNDGEWEEKRLFEVCEKISQGGTPDTTNIDYWKGLIEWLTPAEMGKLETRFVHSTVRKITETGLKNCSSDLLPINSVILSTRAPIGHLVINKTEMAMNQGCKALIPNNKTNYNYLFYCLAFHKKQLSDLGAGNTFKELSANSLKNYKVLIPALQEQQKIASCLSSLDEVIAAHSQKLDSLKTHKKGLMQNLFPQEGERVPKYRFPEFMNDGGWVVKSLDSLTTKISDGIHTTPNYDDDGEYYFINGNNLIDGEIWVDEKTKRVSEEEYIRHKRDLSESTILLSINGTIGNIAIYNNEKVILGKSACYINVNEIKADKNFIVYFIQTDAVKSYFNSELTGSTIRNLSLKSIKETIIKVPTKAKEQRKIAECLSSLDALITAQAEKIEQLKLHKKGLMQGLFPNIGKGA